MSPPVSEGELKQQISMAVDTYSHVGADLLGEAPNAMNASLRPA
jgi:hypothetical protein